MYTMIVVDDEMEIRRGFCTYFPWQEIGFEIRADFKSAQEAEEYLKEHQTDVLVTDIRMRGMSGIELIEAVRNAGVNMEIVVISGYRDFDYAQQVMKMRVRHYLVKPMKYAQIMEVFTEIRQELDAKNGVQNREEVKPIQEKTEATKNETNEVIRRVKNYIYDHMEDVTLELAAESVRMNPQYLSSYFHQQTGEKFGDYLLKKRMKEAARLLVRSSMRIQEIAVRVGYSTANSFSRSFRQFYGMTTKEYRLRRGENSDE